MSNLVRRGQWWVAAVAIVFLMAGPSWAADKPDTFVLAIGVDNYQKVRKIAGCVNDAKRASATFQGQAGKIYGTVKTVLLLDDQATKNRIDQELTKLENSGKAGDHLVIFLSGHGDLNQAAWSFIPWDFDPAQANNGGISDAAILKCADVAAKQGKKVWIIVDACFAGQLRLNGHQILNRHQDPKGGGVLLMVSSMPSQLSSALGSYSAFAHALAEGLAGEADYNNDGQVTLKEVRRFVYNRVHELCREARVKDQDGAIDYSLSLKESLVLAIQPKATKFQDELAKTDPIDPARQGCHHKVYEVTLKAGQTYTIDLMSGDGRPGPHNPGYFDTFLRIEGPNGVSLSNDDGGDGSNSRMTFTPKVDGKYRIVCTSYAKGATGRFDLRIR